jgi:hypothetical protein
MILRRAEDLSERDNVRLDDLLWNVSRVEVYHGGVRLLLIRAAGPQRELDLLPNDLLQLAI